MSREVQGAVLTVIGVVMVRLVLSGAHLSFVKSSLGLPLVASAVVLIVLGALSLLREQEDELALAGPGDRHDHGHGHDHARAPRIGLLVLVPILTLVLVAPQPLGAAAADRGGANRVATPSFALGPLPEPVDGAVTLSLGEAVLRALVEPDGPLLGTPVRLVGFVAADHEAPTGYRLSRFAIACCAADASVRQVLLVGTGELPDDTWVEAVAVFEGRVEGPAEGDSGAGVPVLRVIEERIVERPAAPYEY
ncbi:TIGR03943 family putative permease subunit [Nitriliruptor alkaliphilus]|uniref:TIGR03943 family putative permease subunit n=1 Tax=Nitriliruptor alkaliphilus TaxID=427918 RepID=UPI000696C274|nr:TIGR03943 family protein [Nitriliruptor alkaliphilus]